MNVRKKTASKLIAVGFLSIGIFILMQIILPVISFQLWMASQAASNKPLISPTNLNGQVLGVSVQNKDNFPAFISSIKRETQPSYNKFTLSIPKLKIVSTEVLVDSNDLSTNLAHLPGSALPGEKGNMFISGHSALSQWLPLKSATFSRLTDLKRGDQIIAETPSAQFTYEVINLQVINPGDLSVLKAPEDQSRYISLMTCVPPGLNFKRLVVLGKML